ncbi:PAS domain S-box-containing protein/diguanylate cyclase (GGDEF)-like protein [Diaminobutyricimonas aerilata]|uniref:PAS domain S-box-containing protein/diguanylate cyclase (GGDEF)-like protein n=1 Tax=Diaminobutyricimonas aerilata TaxID=1162967 RepID=A0A2M9CG59_9MICO|nr:sensor domain-containing diguanylate cyclase [Diaminobutyricimonas aerilata]PJJ70850.1 PAS domain S-box-containing protein/diguanylate cyclase (GGDEF)-like protein [Diaminobutyricimonas aerilata]
MTDGIEGTEPAEDLVELYEGAPCGLLSTTPDGVITRVNSTFAGWLGRSAADLHGVAFRDLLTTAGQLFYETRYAPVLNLSGEVREVALTARRDSGELPILANAVLVRDAAGAPVSVRVAVFDASERQDYERRLLAAQRTAAASEARVRALQEASSAFSAAHSERDLARALASATRTALVATRAIVLLLDDDGVLRAQDEADAVLGDALAPLASEALHDGTVITLADLDDAAAASADLSLAFRDARLEAVSIAPLHDDGAPLGAVVGLFARARRIDAEVTELHATLARQAAQVFVRLRLQGELEYRALHDQLTGLPNRKLLQERLDSVLAGARRRGRPVAVIFLDLDGFKRINDELGHRMGDAVLSEVASRLACAVRREDVVGRYGGDEFVVVCEDTESTGAGIVAERLRSEVARPLESVPSGYPVTASIGLAVWMPTEPEPPTPDVALRAADEAMYASKRAGRDRVTLVAL